MHVPNNDWLTVSWLELQLILLGDLHLGEVSSHCGHFLHHSKAVHLQSIHQDSFYHGNSAVSLATAQRLSLHHEPGMSFE